MPTNQKLTATAALVASAGQEDESSSNSPSKRFHRRKRVRMGEALRKQGIDEHAVAATLAGVVDMLKDKTEANDNVDKLLVDVLKECSKHLEEDSKSLGTPAVRVNLIHNVARPKRNPAPAPPLTPGQYPAASCVEPEQDVGSPL